MLGAIPCRVGYRAGWDAVPGGMPCRVGYSRTDDCVAAQVIKKPKGKLSAGPALRMYKQ